jgi:hypothetical protein
MHPLSLECTAISSITWIFCPGLTGVKGNEKADKLVDQPPIDGDLRLDKEEILECICDKFEKILTQN